MGVTGQRYQYLREHPWTGDDVHALVVRVHFRVRTASLDELCLASVCLQSSGRGGGPGCGPEWARRRAEAMETTLRFLLRTRVVVLLVSSPLGYNMAGETLRTLQTLGHSGQLVCARAEAPSDFLRDGLFLLDHVSKLSGPWKWPYSSFRSAAIRPSPPPAASR